MSDRKREDTLHLQSSDSIRTRRARNIGTQRCVTLLGLFVVLGAVACATPSPNPPRGLSSAYTVGAPDQLGIEILPSPEMKFNSLVRPDGKISVPLIGEVMAAGLTIPEIAADIEARMTKFKRGAQVTVSLIAGVHNDITVFGEVASPSSFPLVKDTRIVEALAQVGGTNTFAWDSRIRVIRVVEGQTEVTRVDLTKIRKGELTTNMILKPGDIVYVPSTILARVGYAINAVLFPFNGILGLARTGATSFVP